MPSMTINTSTQREGNLIYNKADNGKVSNKYLLTFVIGLKLWDKKNLKGPIMWDRGLYCVFQLA